MACNTKQYTGCATCFRKYDCPECMSRVRGSDMVLGSIFLIAIFVGITLFVFGG